MTPSQHLPDKEKKNNDKINEDINSPPIEPDTFVNEARGTITAPQRTATAKYFSSAGMRTGNVLQLNSYSTCSRFGHHVT
jgi:hypothetical protein